MKSALWYNTVINVFWTILGFAPVMVYWINYYSAYSLFFTIVISYFLARLPLSKFSLSNNRKYYEKLGIKKAQWLTQNGHLVNSIIKKRTPDYAVIKRRTDLKRYRAQTLVYEKYHFFCFAFFMITAIMAIYDREYLWCLLILSANFIYNVYPILIQQYNRLRMKRDSQ